MRPFIYLSRIHMCTTKFNDIISIIYTNPRCTCCRGARWVWRRVRPNAGRELEDSRRPGAGRAEGFQQARRWVQAETGPWPSTGNIMICERNSQELKMYSRNLLMHLVVKLCNTCSCHKNTNVVFCSQVMFWKHRVDRQCIERLKNFQNPPILVGHIMEMVFTLIGKKSVSRHERADYPSKDDHSARYSASSSSTKLTQKKSKCRF